MYGTGFFPSEKNDYYSIPEDGLYLVGTSEVPLIGMHMEEILEQLPIRYCAFSSCFRREAGAAAARRGRGGGPLHARHVPCAPVPEGRDGRVHAPRRVVGSTRADARARGVARAGGRAAVP